MGEGRRELGQNGWKVVLPSARLTLLQVLIGVVDLGFCALAMYLLMPMAPYIDFVSLAVVFILATLLGFASHAPGSIGVFDAAMLVALPQFGIAAIKAKIDSGARTSSLHVESLDEFEQDGRPWLRFAVLTGRRGHPAVLGAPRRRPPRSTRHRQPRHRRYGANQPLVRPPRSGAPSCGPRRNAQRSCGSPVPATRQPPATPAALP